MYVRMYVLFFSQVTIVQHRYAVDGNRTEGLKREEGRHVTHA